MPNYTRYVQYLFVVLLAVGCIAIVSYDVFYGIPEQKCVASHGWWSNKWRMCGRPIKITDITGIKADVPAVPKPK